MGLGSRLKLIKSRASDDDLSTRSSTHGSVNDFSVNTSYADNVESTSWSQFWKVAFEDFVSKGGGKEIGEESVSRRRGGGDSSLSSWTKRHLGPETHVETLMLESSHSVGKYIIKPYNRWLRLWKQLLMLLAAYSAIITPFEFAFFNVPPLGLRITDNIVNVFFLVEIVLTFFVAVKDKRTYSFITDHKTIALMYLKTTFVFELINIIPWDFCYIAAGAGFNSWEQLFRWMTWFRILRAGRVQHFFQMLQKDIRLSYFAVRIVDLLCVELYATHVAGCIFYFLALTYPPDQEGLTWMGSLTLGGFSYENFRELDLFTRYVTSLYWAVVTMATLGYGDIHPVNPREMIFGIIFMTFDLLLSAYLVGNITALVVKGSSTTEFREKMASLVTYMNRMHLNHKLRDEMRKHLRLQFEADQADDDILDEFPIIFRHKVFRSLFWKAVHDCELFRGCSDEFVNQVVTHSSPHYCFPDEVIVLQRVAPYHLFIVVEGDALQPALLLPRRGHRPPTRCAIPPLHRGRGVGGRAHSRGVSQPGTHGRPGRKPSARDGDHCLSRGGRTAVASANLALTDDLDASLVKGIIAYVSPGETFGEIAVLCNIPQPYEVTAKELTQVLRIDKEKLQSIIGLFILDGRKIVEHMVQRTVDEGSKFHALSSEIHNLIDQQEAELIMTTIYAASRGDLNHIKKLIQAGANASKADYDGRSPLHLAAANGFDDVVSYLIVEGANVNYKDNFGTTPLLEALRSGHDSTAKIILRKGGTVTLQEAGTDLCNAVIHGDMELLQRLLEHGVDPNSADYDLRTPLHIASAEGLQQIAQYLIQHGADIMARDRWGNTVLDEARRSGNKDLVAFLETSLSKKTGARAPASGKPAATAAAGTALSQATDASGIEAAPQKSQDRWPGSQGGFDPLPVDEGGGMATPREPSRAPSTFPSPGSSAAPSPGRYRKGGMGPRRTGPRSGPPRPGYGPSASGKRRVTVYPFPPWTGGQQRKVGRVLWLPDTLPELLEAARNTFGTPGLTHVLSADGGEIYSMDLILDSDRLYLATDKDVEEESMKDGAS